MKTLDRFALRLPESLSLKLKRIAKKNRRSLNGEIVDRMERSLAGLHLGELNDEDRLGLIYEVLGMKDAVEKTKFSADSD